MFLKTTALNLWKKSAALNLWKKVIEMDASLQLQYLKMGCWKRLLLANHKQSSCYCIKTDNLARSLLPLINQNASSYFSAIWIIVILGPYKKFWIFHIKCNYSSRHFHVCHEICFALWFKVWSFIVEIHF